MGRLGIFELVVIFLAIVLLFGPKALPDIARGLGEAIRNFKKAMDPEEKSGGEKDQSPQNRLPGTDA